MVAAKRPPKLQVATQFEDCVSRMLERHLLNNKLIANVPKRPGENPNAQPSNMAVASRGSDELGKQVGEVGITPLSANHFTKAGPKELGRVAREKDVVSILNRATDGAHSITRAITLEDFKPRGEASTDPLPQEDPNFQRKSDVPDQAKWFRGHRGSNGAVQGLRGETARGLEAPGKNIPVLLDVNRNKCDVLEEGVPGGHLEGAKGAPEGETP
nr:uncharacterized protein LOC120974800 [Aegilops tauschii subsp. strangulata]